MLAQFLKWMADENLVNLDDVTKNDDDGFRARFRIQKCVFVAQHLGLGMGYSYSSYKHGPYSPKLTQSYYRLKNEKVDTDQSLNFEEAATCRMIMTEHDDDWLEIATTLVHASKRETSIDSLIEYVECIKYPYPKKYIRAVLDDLRETKLAGMFDKLV